MPVLFGADLELPRGEVLGVLGPNGAGKTTSLRVVSGLEAPSAGTVHQDGVDITALSPSRHAERGLVTVLAGRSTFPDLTVAKNLRVSGHILRGTAGLLDERTPRPSSCSHASPSDVRALRASCRAANGRCSRWPGRSCSTRPCCVSLGLAPTLVDRLSEAVRGFRDRGGSVLLVEQSIPVLRQAADRVALMERGVIRQVLADASELAVIFDALA